MDILSETEKEQSLALGLFASAIVKKRIQLGLTQKKFAERYGVTQAMVSKWESGEYNLTLEKMIEILNMLSIEYSIEIDRKKVGTHKNIGKSLIRPQSWNVSENTLSLALAVAI